jgi:ABC-2 type transport system ATP-binding protein
VPVLEYQGIRKEYKSRWGKGTVCALDDFSLAVEKGEIVGFLGPNGAGKTTAIHLAMGFMRATAGSGQMLGTPFGDASARKRVGFLAENVALFHRPVRALIAFYGGLNGVREPELSKSVSSVLELLELRDVEQRNASKLSRGMLQRVGLAQALVNDPELLILDEPTSALDPLGRVAVRELLGRMKSQGKTIFLSSHLLSEIEMVCDRVAILNHGRLVRVGKTSELLESAEESDIVAIGVKDWPGAVASNGAVTITVQREMVRSTIERIWMGGGDILRVNPRHRSLEDIFLELTHKENTK